MGILFTKIHNIKNDRLLFISMHLSYAFLFLHFLCRNDSAVRMPFEIRLITILVYTPIVVFCGRKGATFWTVLYASLMLYFSGVHNYAPFIIVILVTKNSIHQHKVAAISLYLIVFLYKCAFSVPTYYIFVHIIKCFLIFYLIFIIFREYGQIQIANLGQKNELSLTPDEENILSLLAEGLRISELSIFSANTICKKLKEARERNNIKDNQELILAYRNSKYYKKG